MHTHPSWYETSLWKQLEAKKDMPDADVARRTLLDDACMQAIVHVLARGETSPSDFTLHDEGHGFRVAQRMARLVPPDVLPQLSGHELALLLLSAYLHDIGMTPERRKVRLHREWLLTGQQGELSGKEMAAFQRWLDEEGHQGIPPLRIDRPEDLRRADRILTYYCRHRHNDWSEEWIRAHLPGCRPGLYHGWIDDLVALCRSHHEGRRALEERRFDPILAGTPPVVVHRRYLAVVLRVADILENDPERTPEVVLQHREIAASSLIYWYKDHHFSIEPDPGEPKRLVLSARPTSARIHRAVEETAHWIDEELTLARALADELHFDRCPGITKPLPHRWDFFPTLHRHIESGGPYEYIDGAFRPDTPRLLELLSGTALYKNPLAAVRELLQNAFDAVREQIAWQRLAQPSPGEPRWERHFGEQHQVELRYEVRSDGAYLVCRDDGVGMSKAIIRDHLLVSGKARRGDVLDLERRCREHGFSVGRTGQFGIGVLSYFMIADHITLRTRRSLEPGDSETTGWCFETEGVGSFGELRHERGWRRGTEVVLRLRPEVVGDAGEWLEELCSYLDELLMWVPCRFVLSGPDRALLSAGPGWVRSEERIKELALAGMDDRVQEALVDEQRARRGQTAEYRSPRRREYAERVWRDQQELLHGLRAALGIETCEGSLAHGAVRYRIHLPYFALPEGASVGYFCGCDYPIFNDAGNSISRGLLHAHAFKGSIGLAWKGIRVAREEPGHSGRLGFTPDRQIIELDIADEAWARISVSRDEMLGLGSFAKLERELKRAAREQKADFNRRHRTSRHALYNAAALQYPVDAGISLFLPAESDPLDPWQPITFPLVTGKISGKGWTWQGRVVSTVPHFATPRERGSKPIVYPSIWRPDRLILIANAPPTPGFLWEAPPHGSERPTLSPPRCRFPAAWSHLFMATNSDGPVLNEDHPLLRMVDEESLRWAIENSFIFNSLEILADHHRLAAWLLLWQPYKFFPLLGFYEDEPERVQTLLEELSPERGLFFLVFEAPEEPSYLCMLTPKGAQVIEIRNMTDLEPYLPDPGPEWWVLPPDPPARRERPRRERRRKA